jgi:hypothetical protein
MQRISGDTGEYIWAGLAITRRNASGVETIMVGYREVRIYPLVGRAQIFITYGTTYNGWHWNWNDGELRHIIVHELGHALGWTGHSKVSTDVMYHGVPINALGYISYAEARHLRQIYELFR